MSVDHVISSNKFVILRGDDRKGQLGQGAKEDKIPLPKKASFDLNGNITKILAKGNFTAILTNARPEESSIYPATLNVPILFNDPDSHPDMEFTLDGEIICHAHKNIVCKCSKYFDTMFRNEMKESAERQFPIHYSEGVFLNVIKFIYGVKIEKFDPLHLPELYEAGDFYCMEGLKDWCIDSLAKGLTLDNVGPVLQDVFDRKFQELEEVCMEFIVENVQEWSKRVEAYEAHITSSRLWAKIFLATLNP